MANTNDGFCQISLFQSQSDGAANESWANYTDSPELHLSSILIKYFVYKENQMLHIGILFVNVFKPLGVTILMIHFLYSILMGCNLLAIN